MENTTTPPDYSLLIDKQTQAFIQRTEAAFPENAASLDIQQQRALYDAMCQRFNAGHPAGIASNDAVVTHPDSSPLPIRRYTPVSGSTEIVEVQIIYLHGGGFVVGNLESHDDICAEICDLTRAIVTSVDYRLSPEHKHPAALNDAMRVIEHLHDTYGQPILVCGDSAGANLGAAACHAYRNRVRERHLVPAIIGQVLIYPGLGGDIASGSYVTHACSPMLSTQDVQYYSDIRCSTDTNTQDALFAPLCDDDFGSLPPTVVFSAECDPLCDDGKHYCQRIQHSGGRAHWIKERGLVHGYLRARHSVDRAARSFERIIEALDCLMERRWPYG